MYACDIKTNTKLLVFHRSASILFIKLLEKFDDNKGVISSLNKGVISSLNKGVISSLNLLRLLITPL
jgi:hypothetical protein